MNCIRVITLQQYDATESWTSLVSVIGALDGFFRVRGYWSDAIDYGRLAVKAAHHLYESQPNDLPRGLDLVHFKSGLATTYALQGRYKEAERPLENALKVCRQLDDEAALAPVLQLVGLLAEARGDDKRAERLYHQALERIQRIGHLPSIALTLEQLASLARERRDYQQALNLCREKLALDKLSRTPVQIGAAPPLLGQHTEQVLSRDLGYAAADIARLRDEGVI